MHATACAQCRNLVFTCDGLSPAFHQYHAKKNKKILSSLMFVCLTLWLLGIWWHPRINPTWKILTNLLYKWELCNGMLHGLLLGSHKICWQSLWNSGLNKMECNYQDLTIRTASTRDIEEKLDRMQKNWITRDDGTKELHITDLNKSYVEVIDSGIEYLRDCYQDLTRYVEEKLEEMMGRIYYQDWKCAKHP